LSKNKKIIEIDEEMILSFPKEFSQLVIDLNRDLAGSRFNSIWQTIRGRTSLKNHNVQFGDLPEARLEKFCAALKTLSSLQTLSLSFIK